ncbi:uncharacterized protein LOC126971381 [Leptidea sinapis]|uniref:uncharacterized protein LOC126971381 n=1 Tax=Leptidea sinapis TaxID=189913 RepID=UPI00213E9126|nr:uncharacterized protein LOC126971381 [Leptidea sinapis]
MLKNKSYVYGRSDRYVLATLHFGEYLLKKIWQNKDVVALINGATDEKLFYGEIAQDAMNLAVSLVRLGVKKGDVIALSSENRREYWSSVIGCICAGTTVTTINLTYTKDELKHVMNIGKPKYLICSPYAYKAHEKSYRSLGYLKKIIVYGAEKHRATIPYSDLTVPNATDAKWGLTENIKYDDFLPVEVNGYDTVFLLYSSGTTGLPKGVMLSHISILTCCSPTDEAPPLVSLVITPWYHTMGLVTCMINFCRGRTSVYLQKFEVELYMKTIEKYKIEVLGVVPPILVALCKSNLQYDTSSVMLVTCGAAPLYEETAEAVKKRFPSVMAVLQGYGMTESTLILTFNDNTEKIGSVGTVMEHVVLKVVHPETREVLGPNKEGEICAKGVPMMKGYLGKDRKEDFDDEGFFRTGDMGYYDEEGCFYIVDRLKELIKYKGYQVPPAEIEAVLLKHPGIRDAGVVGIPDTAAGELPAAFVVLQPGAALTEQDIKNYVAENLSNPKHLRGGVRFLNEIPKNPSGKILRRELRKLVKSNKSKL